MYGSFDANRVQGYRVWPGQCDSRCAVCADCLYGRITMPEDCVEIVGLRIRCCAAPISGLNGVSSCNALKDFVLRSFVDCSVEKDSCKKIKIFEGERGGNEND